MRKFGLLCILWLSVYCGLQAQQDPMFTKYLFSPLIYNPAYAGSLGALDMTAIHRHQWFGMQGAPMTQAFNVHSPVKTKNIGVGMNMMLDRIGVSRQFSSFASFAYRIPFGNPEGKKGKGGYIGLGLQGGVSNFAADWSQLNLDNPNDPSFQNLQPNLLLPNFGTGIYIQTETWYVGLSAPMLISNDLRRRTPNEPTVLPIAQQYRHYYLSAGTVIKASPILKIRPSFLLKNVGLFMDRNQLNGVGAPTEFNIDLGFLFNDVIWFGTSFRSALEVIDGSSSYDSVDFWLSFRLKNGLRLGLAYDYTLTRIQAVGIGSYELMLGYDLYRPNVDKVEHPRYF